MATTDLVTILSTDWVESTATRVRLGEDRADVLQRAHDDVLRDVVTTRGGTVIKGSGDGVLATFHSAADAIASAVDVQQRVHGLTRRGDALAEIQLRVGLSAGDVVHRDGDIFGTPIIEAVRLQAAAAPGEILCSDLVVVLARGRGGFQADAVGLLDLKGLPDPVAASTIRWAPSSTGRESLPLPPELGSIDELLFVGRDAELDAALGLARSDRGAQVMWLLGEPGIGKSRLAAEISRRLRGDGATVLFGRCDEQVLAPFQPFIEALRWFVSHTPDEHLADAVGTDPVPLVRLVPELAHRLPGLPAPSAEPTDADQLRLFEAVAAWLDTSSREGPLVLVVDDVHWADRPTLSLLGHVLRRAAPSRLLVVATARDTDPDASDPLRDLIDDLDRTGRSRRFSLAGLTERQIALLLPADARSAAELAVETGGNPLYLATLLATTGSAAPEGAGDIRAAVRRRVRGVAADVLDLLQTASIVGLEFSMRVAARAAGVSDDAALERLEQACRAGLVHEVAVDRFRFAHALTRDALEDELSASRRARLHVAVARAIEARHRPDLEEHLRSLAHHYAKGAASNDGNELAQALDYRRRAGRRALDLLAFDAAVDDFRATLELAGRLPALAPETRLTDLMALGTAQHLAADHPGAMATLRRATDLARSLDDWPAFAAAALAFEESVWPSGGPGHEAARLLSEAAGHASTLDDETAIRLDAALGRALAFTGDRDEAKRVTLDAVERARRHGDPDVLAHALSTAGSSLWNTATGGEEAELVMALARELYGIESSVDDRLLLANMAQYGGQAAMFLGDRDGAAWWFERERELGESLRSRFVRYMHACWRCTEAFLDADLATAEARVREQEAIGAELADDVSGLHALQMFMIRREQDRLAEVAPAVRLLLRNSSLNDLWKPGLAVLLAELGMNGEARAVLDDAARDRFATVPGDALQSGAFVLLAQAAARLGDREHAEVLRGLLAPWSGYGLSIGLYVANLGATDRYLALLDAVIGDDDAADQRFERALAFNRRLRSPLWIAHTLADWGEHRAARHRPGATRLLDEARALADRHGVAAVLRQLGATTRGV